MATLLGLIVPLLAAAGLLALVAGARALLRRPPLRGTLDVAIGPLLFLNGALVLTLSVATHGDQAFMREVLAAWGTVTPTGIQRFTARFSLSRRTRVPVHAGRRPDLCGCPHPQDGAEQPQCRGQEERSKRSRATSVANHGLPPFHGLAGR